MFRNDHDRFNYPNEEVDHEEDVEGEVDLLGGVLVPGDALFDADGGGVDEVNDERSDRQDEHKANLKSSFPP